MRVLIAGFAAALLASPPPALAEAPAGKAPFNGVRQNGLAENGIRHNGIRHNGVRHNAMAGAEGAALPVPRAILLQSGRVLSPE